MNTPVAAEYCGKTRWVRFGKRTQFEATSGDVLSVVRADFGFVWRENGGPFDPTQGRCRTRLQPDRGQRPRVQQTDDGTWAACPTMGELGRAVAASGWRGVFFDKL